MPHPACALFAIEKPATLSTSAASKDRIGIFIDFPLGVDGLNARPAIASVGRGAPLGSAVAVFRSLRRIVTAGSSGLIGNGPANAQDVPAASPIARTRAQICRFAEFVMVITPGNTSTCTIRRHQAGYPGDT